MVEGGTNMSTKEVERYAIIKRALAGDITQALAARQLNLSVRQVKRLCAAVRCGGSAALISKKRGQASNRRIPEQRRATILDLVSQHYSDFGPQLASEYLLQGHQQSINAETLRNWMIQAGLWKPKVRRAKRQHPGRARRARAGELVQIDGSPHDWFEGRSDKCCLIAFIDDASGQVFGAKFFPTETTQGYLEILHQYVRTHGAPLALYSDRHSIFTKHDPEDAQPTQFERALLQLNIEPICAHSPQAKGRVERLFQTLQDRLCKAMRVAGINTMGQANDWLAAYLKEHNRRFAVAPRESKDAHRPYTGSADDLARICALHHQRQLSAALSCRFEGSIVQLEAVQTNGPKGRARVDIAEHADGTLEVLYHGRVLAHKRYGCHGHLSHQRNHDEKTVNQRVDELGREQRRIQQLKSQIAHQNDLRASGVHQIDTHISAPPVGAQRYGLRPSHCAPTGA